MDAFTKICQGKLNKAKKTVCMISFVINRHAQQLVPSAPNELSVVTGGGTADTVKFEEKRMMSASKTKVIKDGFSSEQVKIAK